MPATCRDVPIQDMDVIFGTHNVGSADVGYVLLPDITVWVPPSEISVEYPPIVLSWMLLLSSVHVADEPCILPTR